MTFDPCCEGCPNEDLFPEQSPFYIKNEECCECLRERYEKKHRGRTMEIWTVDEETYKAINEIDRLSIELATGVIKKQNITLIDYESKIARQKAEIDRLKSENLALSQKRITMVERIDIVNNARNKAIREFAERLKSKEQMVEAADYFFAVSVEDIDELVKEMTEEKP